MRKYLKYFGAACTLYLKVFMTDALASDNVFPDSYHYNLADGLYDFGTDYWYIFLIVGSVLMFVLGVLVVLMIVRKDKEVAGPMLGSTKKEVTEKKSVSTTPASNQATTPTPMGKGPTPASAEVKKPAPSVPPAAQVKTPPPAKGSTV